MSNELISTLEAARIAGVTKETIQNLCKGGYLSYAKKGKMYRVDRAEVEKYADSICAISKATDDIEQYKREIERTRGAYHEQLRSEQAELAARGSSITSVASIGALLEKDLMRYRDNFSDLEYTALRSLFDGMRLDIIARRYNVTRERVRQVRDKAVRRYGYIKNESDELRKRIAELEQELQQKDNVIRDYEGKIAAFKQDYESKQIVLPAGVLVPSEQARVLAQKFLNEKIHDFDVSVRLLNCITSILGREATIKDVFLHTAKDFIVARNFGKKTLNELREFGDAYNLRLGMTEDEMVSVMTTMYADKIYAANEATRK